MKFRIVLLFITGLGFTGCGQVKLDSTWAEKPVTIDGDLTEWKGMFSVPKGVKAGVGFMNNEEFLYCALTTSDLQLMRQIVYSGFTVWFDEKGKKKQVFGIRHPLTNYGVHFKRMAKNWQKHPQHLLFALQDYLENNYGVEVFGPGKGEFTQLTFSNRGGVAVRTQLHEGVLSYELRLPLNPKPGEFGLQTSFNTRIGIGLTTPEMDRENMKMQVSARRGKNLGMRGGINSGMGSRGGMGKGRGGGTRPGEIDPINIWAKVKLAKHS